MLFNHFTDTVTIKRKSLTGRKTTFSNFAINVPCLIQRLSGEQLKGDRGKYNSDYHIFIENEVKIGDKLVDQNNKEYDVVGVTSVRFAGFIHYEADLLSI